MRRKRIKDVLKGRDKMVLNHNPQLYPTAGIGQIIVSKKIVIKLGKELRKCKIERLPLNYNPLNVTSRSHHLGKRRERALKSNQVEVMRN